MLLVVLSDDALSHIIEVGGLVVAHRASGACQRLRWLADGKLRAWLVVRKHREWIADQQYLWCVASGCGCGVWRAAADGMLRAGI